MIKLPKRFGMPEDVKTMIKQGNENINKLWDKMNELVLSNNEMEERISVLEEKCKERKEE